MEFYECSLQRMEQRNLQTGRVRRLRAPPVASSENTSGFHHPTLLQQRRRWNEEEEEEEDEESLGSSVLAASPSYGTSRCMRPKVAAVTAVGVVTGVCVVGGDHLFGETLHRQFVTVVALLGTLFLAAQCLDSARVATGSVHRTYKEFARILLLRCCRQAVRPTELLLQLLLLLRRLLLRFILCMT